MAIAKTPTLSHRLSALLLLLLVIVGFLWLVDRVLVGRYHFYRERLEQQQGRLAQLERMAASREPIQRLIDTVRQDHGMAAQYLPKAAPPLAAAELQQRVKGIVEAAGATLRSMQALAPVEEGNAVKVAVSTTLMGDPESLRKILRDLESQTPLLFVDNLDVSGRENRPRLPNGRLASYTRIQLTVQFEVSGYLHKESG